MHSMPCGYLILIMAFLFLKCMRSSMFDELICAWSPENILTVEVVKETVVGYNEPQWQ